MKRKHWMVAGAVVLWAALSGGCKHTAEVKPIKIEPIHITLDVNVKVDQELDDFFGDIDAASDTMQPARKLNDEEQ